MRLEIFILSVKNVKQLGLNLFKKVKSLMAEEERILAKGTAIAFWGIFGVNLTSFILLTVKTRTMTAVDVGILVLARSAVLIFFVLAAGFYGAVLRYISVYRGEQNNEKVKGVILMTYKYGVPCMFILLLGINVAGHFLAYNVFHKPEILNLLRVYSVAMFARNIWGVNASMLSAKYLVKYKYIFAIQVQVITLMLYLCFFAFGQRNFLLMFCFAEMIGHFVVAVLSMFHIKKEFSFVFDKVKKSIEDKKSFFRYVFVTQLTNLLIRFRLEANVFIMGFFLVSSEIAIYNIAFQIGMAAMVMLEGLNAIFPVVIGRLYGEKKIAAIKSLHKKTAAIMGSISVIIFMFFLFFGKYILMIFGLYYERALVPLLVIAFSFVVESAVGSVGRILNMMGRPHYNTVNTFVALIITLGLCYFLVPRYGALGAALSFSLSNIVKRLLMLTEVLFLYKQES